MELWETTYFHVLEGNGDLLAWMRGTALRPCLDLFEGGTGAAFEEAYLERLPGAYDLQPDGRLRFPFRRQFVLAVR